MKLLSLFISADGHHLEYLEHLISMAKDMPNDFFIFVLHPEFKRIRNFGKDLEYKNIVIDYLDKKEVIFKKGRILSSYQKCNLLKSKIKQYKVDKVFLVMFMPFSPFIFIKRWNNVDMCGIIYTIYLYKWKELSLLEKLYNVIRYKLISTCSNIKYIYILNDSASTKILNKIYNTNKFVYLVDPFRPIYKISNIYNIRRERPNKTIISHIGTLKERKGTYNILNAINELSSESLSKYTFIFAGKAEDDIRFEKELSQIVQKADIVYYRGFIPFEQIGEIIKSSDLLLLPYYNTNQSSGIIGYAAQFNIPVVVPKEKLLAKLVKNFNLGYFIKDNSTNSIITFLENWQSPKQFERNDKYLKTNNIDNFITIIKNNI